jgi:hypothetical protein
MKRPDAVVRPQPGQRQSTLPKGQNDNAHNTTPPARSSRTLRPAVVSVVFKSGRSILHHRRTMGASPNRPALDGCQYHCRIGRHRHGDGAMTRAVSLTIRARIGGDDGPVVSVCGREAWALTELSAAGERGCTPIDHPGPRWSAYVYDLRKLGIVIETIRERHGGPFSGEHARYVLRSRVVILGSS